MTNNSNTPPRNAAGTVYILSSKSKTDPKGFADSDVNRGAHVAMNQSSGLLLPPENKAPWQLSREGAEDAQYEDLDSPTDEGVRPKAPFQPNLAAIFAGAVFTVFVLSSLVFHAVEKSGNSETESPTDVANKSAETLRTSKPTLRLPAPHNVGAHRDSSPLEVAETDQTTIPEIETPRKTEITPVTPAEARNPINALPATNEQLPTIVAVEDAARKAPKAILSTNELSVEEILQKGQKLLRSGDISAARALFQSAADQGAAEAALAMGATFDPKALAANGHTNVAPNVHKALHWYRRAHILAKAKARKNG